MRCIFDGEGSDRTFKDFTENVYAPNFSHHKLTVFEYADGNNTVAGKGNTDLDMYYAKLTLAYGTNSGRALPSYPTNDDFEKLKDEALKGNKFNTNNLLGETVFNNEDNYFYINSRP